MDSDVGRWLSGGRCWGNVEDVAGAVCGRRDGERDGSGRVLLDGVGGADGGDTDSCKWKGIAWVSGKV